jgi:hypothetical protein
LALSLCNKGEHEDCISAPQLEVLLLIWTGCDARDRMYRSWSPTWTAWLHGATWDKDWRNHQFNSHC